jgi:outer membrane lipoprotein SlyB
MIRGNRLRLRTDGGEASLRFSSIRVLEVRRQRRDRSVEGGILGTLLGAFLGRFTLLGLGGSHWKAQGRLLAPGLGAIAGGLIGALVGSQILGDYWEPIPVPLTVY